MARDDEGVAAGCGALLALGHGAAEIKRMFVRRSLRGQGVGALVLAALEAEARERGWSLLRLETGDAQHEAIGLYTSRGYREVDCWGAYAGSAISRCYERRLE